MSMQKKIALLQKIKEEKEILFGSFSATLTKPDKEKKWGEVKDLAEDLGLIKDKHWTYVRDTVWANWRKRTLLKMDNAKATGTGGGKSVKMNEMDSLVLDILGNDNPAVVGLGRKDSMQSVSDDDNKDECLQEEERSPASKSTRAELEQENCKKIKLLQTEHLELQNYKLLLEILELEKKLGFPRSSYTQHLPQPLI